MYPRLHTFQSTPLTRGETYDWRVSGAVDGISIHSPHTRGDNITRRSRRLALNFNPLPSYEGRRRYAKQRQQVIDISIHSPHTRGDIGGFARAVRCHAISIHSPHTRGDLKHLAIGHTCVNFNPLPSYEGRLLSLIRHSSQSDFNPLPSYEGRPAATFSRALKFNFNPLPSYEGRH